MQAARLVDELSARMSELLAAGPARDIEKNVRALFSASLSRLDLVTREEFDVQAKILARAQEKLVALEARVEELEQALKARG
jgi:BMFP domain-containing protein YqiC